MTKSIKRYALIIAAVLLSVTLAACSTKASTEEIINKSSETAKNLKNTNFSATNTSEVIIGDQTQKVENKINGSIILDPFAIHATTEIATEGKSQKLELYIKDGTAYAQSTGQSDWVKSSSEAITSQFENLKKIANSTEVLDFYKKLAKDFKVTEENGNYVLTYSGNGDQFKELMAAVANSSSGNQVTADAFNNVDFKNVTIKYVVNKNFEPVSNETTMELATKDTTTPTTMKMTQIITYSKINNVSSIELPEAVKGAQEVNNTNNNE